MQSVIKACEDFAAYGRREKSKRFATAADKRIVQEWPKFAMTEDDMGALKK